MIRIKLIYVCTSGDIEEWLHLQELIDTRLKITKNMPFIGQDSNAQIFIAKDES